MTDLDTIHMSRALELAERGRGAVEPNPLVGAVVAHADAVVGAGFHAVFGGPHAEVVALDAAGPRARGATLYVTLEPCCHHGKTPPCTDRIRASGVQRVVVADEDPFPQVSGRGCRILRDAGLVVDVGCRAEEARRLNRPYRTLLEEQRPFVHAKWAMTLDGKIASATGESKWISNETSRRHAHRFRGTVDGILVGLGTVLADDPLLTARPPGPRIATRVVLDSGCRMPSSSRLVRTARETSTLIATTGAAPTDDRRRLEDAGCELLELPDDGGRVRLEPLLAEFGRRRWTNLLVEGGSEILGSFLAAGLVDAVRVYLAARLLGGTDAKTPIGGPGLGTIAQALSLRELGVEPLDGDLFLAASR